MEINKEAMIDSKGAARTQSLFLETSYGDPENAMYTLKPRDHMYKGKLLPSIKRLYLEMEDPTEYFFAYEYFLDWDHWQQIKKNKVIAEHMKGWQEELEVRSRALGVKAMFDLALDGDKPNYQASQFLAKGGWTDRPAGRPSKEAVERETKIQARIKEEFGSDLMRLKR
ncbi:hypothetical protein VP5_002 [Vibrio virus VPMCC5]|nr:hypothetical protein VP5_002 [Vibrio virus VPMCC5]